MNVVQAHPEKYGKDFNAIMSHLGQMLAKKDYNMQSNHIAKTRSQPVNTKVAAFTGKIRCKSTQRQFGILCPKNNRYTLENCKNNKASSPPPSSLARISALEAHLRISSQPEEGDVTKEEGGNPMEQV